MAAFGSTASEVELDPVGDADGGGFAGSEDAAVEFGICNLPGGGGGFGEVRLTGSEAEVDPAGNAVCASRT